MRIESGFGGITGFDPIYSDFGVAVRQLFLVVTLRDRGVQYR